MEKQTRNGWDILLWFVTLIPFVLFDGWIALKLWEWFIYPAFHISIEYKTAIGIGFLLRHWTNQLMPEDDRSVIRMLSTGFVADLVRLSLAFLIHVLISQP